MTLVAALVMCMVFGVSIAPAAAQQTTLEVLSFLLTNRTIITGDFDRDAQAAAATRDTIATFVAQEISTLPVSSSSGGFAYRIDPTLGAVVRATDSFGTFYTERSLTAGRHRASFGIGYQNTLYNTIDGYDLRDGTLVSTAATLNDQQFDAETITLRIRTDVMTLTGNYGLTNRFDVGLAIPFVRMNLQGERVDTYRGESFFQATGSASSSGLGDMVMRLKYNVFDRGASGVSLGLETRLPTGDEDNLLGSGDFTFAPRFIGSVEGDTVGFHGELSYTLNTDTNTLGYRGSADDCGDASFHHRRRTLWAQVRRIGTTHVDDSTSPPSRRRRYHPAHRSRRDHRSPAADRRYQMERDGHLAPYCERAEAAYRRRPQRGLGSDSRVRLLIRQLMVEDDRWPSHYRNTTKNSVR